MNPSLKGRKKETMELWGENQQENSMVNPTENGVKNKLAVADTNTGVSPGAPLPAPTAKQRPKHCLFSHQLTEEELKGLCSTEMSAPWLTLGTTLPNNLN